MPLCLAIMNWALIWTSGWGPGNWDFIRIWALGGEWALNMGGGLAAFRVGNV